MTYKIGSPAADAAYDRWHDKMADEYWGANEPEPCEVCGGNADLMRQLYLDAERYQALKEMSVAIHARHEEAKRLGVKLDLTGTPSIPGVVLVLSAEELDEAVDSFMVIK